MGERLIVFQNYFQQFKPLAVTGSIGASLSSNYGFVVSDAWDETPNNVVLSSNAGQMILFEEEIYRISPVAPDGSFLLYMDGGAQLRFSPVRQNPQPIGY